MVAVTHSTASRDLATNAVVDQLDGAGSQLVFRITGSTVASPSAEVATLTFATPAFGASSSGTATATSSITQDSSATGNAGAVAFATLQTSGGVIAIQCAVAASGSDINMTNGLVVAAADIVSCSSLTYTALSA